MLHDKLNQKKYEHIISPEQKDACLIGKYADHTISLQGNKWSTKSIRNKVANYEIGFAQNAKSTTKNKHNALFIIPPEQREACLVCKWANHTIYTVMRKWHLIHDNFMF